METDERGIKAQERGRGSYAEVKVDKDEARIIGIVSQAEIGRGKIKVKISRRAKNTALN